MVDHIERRMRGFINIRQKMLEQEQQHIPDAAIRTGGDNEFPLTARNQACRTFKINGIVSVDAGIEILHHI